MANNLNRNFNCTRVNCRSHSAICFCVSCRKFICECCFRDICQDHVTKPVTVNLRTIQIGRIKPEVVLHLNQIFRGPDGNFYLVDMDNHLLRQLDGSFNPIANCPLPHRPWGACSFQENGKHKIAVTLRKLSKVVIVDVENDFGAPFNAPTRQFVTPDRCRGIAYHRESDKLIVACGGNDSQASEDVTEGPAQIVVFSSSGNMLFIMTEGLSQPFHVQVGHTGAVYICDRDNGVLVRQLQANGDLTGPKIARNPGNAYTYTVTISTNQQLFVGCHLKATITQFNGDHKVGVILSESGGQIEKPLCVLYDTNGDTERLIVTNEGSDNIQIFTFHF